MIESKSEKNFFENLSVEIILTIFDYLTSIEIVFAFFDLNQRYRLIVHQRFQSNFPLTELDLRNSPFSLVQRFSQTILPRFQSMITSLEIGSQQQYGQIETFRNVAFSRLDNLTIRLIDPNVVTQILRTFLSHNSLQWFDKVSLFLDEITQIWDEWLPFCAIDIPVRQLTIEGQVPYVFAHRLMTDCYTITHLTVHLKFDHDILPLLVHLPNLTDVKFSVDERGKSISNEFALLTSLPRLKRFDYRGRMSTTYLREIVLRTNKHLEELIVSTEDFQWPFESFRTFSIDFIDQLTDLKVFHFNIRLFDLERNHYFSTDVNKQNYLIKRKLCRNIGAFRSKDFGQIFSIPFVFDRLEIFDNEFFSKIRFLDEFQEEKSDLFSFVEHLLLHVNIYDRTLLKSIEENLTNLRSIDYRVPHFSLNPQDHRLDQHGILLKNIRKLIIRDSVKHGCHVAEPLLLLTSRLVELDIEHFYLMQILSMTSQQTRNCLSSVFSRIRRLTVRQFDERLSIYFFSSFPRLNSLVLNFISYKMQIYRSNLPFVDNLLESMPKLISLKFEHVKKPHETQAYVELRKSVEMKFSQFYDRSQFWCKWYDDRTDKSRRYATFFWSK